MLVRLCLVMLLVCSVASRANAEWNCVAGAGDVAAAIQAEVAKADGLYARGDFNGALALYARAYASLKEPVLLYAQGMAQWQLGANAKAKELLSAYIAAGGALTYKDRAEAGLTGLGAGVPAAVSTTGGRLIGGLRGGVEGTGGAVVGAGGDVAGVGEVAGGVRGEVQAKTKVGHKAGVILGVIAIAAIGAVGIHSIAAGVSTDIELDPKFDLGMGVAGVAVGLSAFYVAGLTATTAAAPKCIAGPVMMHGGGGVAAAMRF
jgi:hypothetical protein